MTSQQYGRLGGLVRAQRLTQAQRAEMSRRASVTRWILTSLGQADPRPTISPWHFPYRVRRDKQP